MFNSENGVGYQFGSTGLMPLDIGDDDEFLALLQNNLKQPVSTTYNIAGNSTVAPTTANPADLSVLRTISPPNTESSGSPSPPSAGATGPTSSSAINPDHDGNLLQTPLSAQSSTFGDSIWSNHQRQMSSSTSRSTRSAAAAAAGRDDGGATKRKTLDDLDEESSDEDAPQRKVQHTDGTASKKSGSKRKSMNQDDNRLLKRKEQNRAAQRAFRERKERHVKDLEDKVSILEAKTDTQAAENENLRELLTRLQQENLQLKQNQFRFTFQQPLASTSSASYPPKSTPTPDNLAAPSSTTPSSSITHSPFSDDPLKLLSNNTNISQPQLVNTASPPDLNLLDTLGVGSSNPANDFRNLGFGSSNPFSPMDTSGAPNLSNSNSSLSDMFTSLGDLSSPFPPMPYQTIAANPMYTSFRDPNPNAWASFGPNPTSSMSTYDELFGGGGAVSNLPSSGLNSGSFDDLMPFSFLPDLSNGNQIAGLSPISHLPTPPTAQQGTSSSSSGQPVTTPASDHHDADMTDADGHKKCPKNKEEMAAIIDSQGPSTFGPPVETTETGQVCEKMAMADTTKLNLDIGTAWRAVRQHPQFEECDIDELCAELAKKAKCDGNTKVIEAQKIMDLVHSIPERAKQRKASLATLGNSSTRAV